MPRVFISYSHDSKDRVADLAAKLRASGVQVTVDSDKLPGGPAEGWAAWSEAQVRDCDQVLIACTETYCRRYEGQEAPHTGLGAVCEARAIRQLLYNAAGINEKFRVVIFEDADNRHVPLNLDSYHRYAVYRDDGYRALVSWLKASAVPESRPGLQWPSRNTSFVWRLADREAVFAAFDAMVTGASQKRILLLSGSSNSGKTVLVDQLQRYARGLGIASTLLDLKGCPTLEEVLETMKVDLGASILPGASSASGTIRFQKLIGDLKQCAAPLLLIFDTYQQANEKTREWLETQLLPRIEQAPGLLVVISGQDVPKPGAQAWWQSAETMELKPIRQASDWLDYAHRKLGYTNVTLEQLQVLTLATDGDPGKVNALLETMVRGLRAGESA